MSYQERFKHIAMHYGKYCGRFADILLGGTIGPTEQQRIRKTLVDTFIIVLNSAEIFQLDLDTALRKKLAIEGKKSVTELADSLVESAQELHAELSAEDDRERVLNLMLHISSIGGFMQKVGEELDHMVGMKRDDLSSYTLNLLVILLLGGRVWKVNYEAEVPRRWAEIEEKTFIKGEGPQ
jgi:hypothetical protein